MGESIPGAGGFLEEFHKARLALSSFSTENMGRSPLFRFRSRPRQEALGDSHPWTWPEPSLLG
jgi:hypothetical protein